MDYKEAADRIRSHNRVHSAHERNAIFITKALDLAADVLEKSCWIPCSERLPEENVSVICYMRIGEIVVMEYGGDGWYCGVTRYNPRSVTHWMPLPEPPEVTQDE